MAAGEVDPNLVSSLPSWAQTAANLGVLVGAIAVAGYTFLRHFAGKITFVDNASGATSPLTPEDVKDLREGLHRLAVAGEEMLVIMRSRAREDDIEREVGRRLKEVREHKE